MVQAGTQSGAQIATHLGDLIDSEVNERCRVTFTCIDACDLGKQALHKMPNGHAGGNGMGVDDEVWHNALAREGHVLLGVRDAYSPLLSVP